MVTPIENRKKVWEDNNNCFICRAVSVAVWYYIIRG